MNSNDLLELHKATCVEALEIMRVKNHDYTGDHEDPFKNFRGSLQYDVEPEVGLMIRIGDKFMRVHTMVKKGTLKVTDESVIDSVVDGINYMILLKGMLIERQQGLVRNLPAANPFVLEFKGQDSYNEATWILESFFRMKEQAETNGTLDEFMAAHGLAKIEDLAKGPVEVDPTSPKVQADLKVPMKLEERVLIPSGSDDDWDDDDEVEKERAREESDIPDDMVFVKGPAFDEKVDGLPDDPSIIDLTPGEGAKFTEET